VVGTKGHGVLEELLMGSVTRNLISLAHIPVLVVKD
jgi:nucleotide-binding universal stress UspA family protein